jgi:hypothetical protein
LFNQVLRNAGRCFLQSFFTAGDQGTRQTLAQATALQHAIKANKRDNLKRTGDQTKSRCKITFFKSRVPRTRPFAGLTSASGGTETCGNPKARQRSANKRPGKP